MTITTKGSGGQIRFSGTGGALRIPGSGGGGGGGGGGPSSPVTITPYISGVAQAALNCTEGSIVTFRYPNIYSSPYTAIMDSTAINKDWSIWVPTSNTSPWIKEHASPIQQGDTSGNYGEPMPVELGYMDWLDSAGDFPQGNGVWTDPGTGTTWNVTYRIMEASGISFIARLLKTTV